jgi:predicted DsbA family dithiol-disulfide isomerase
VNGREPVLHWFDFVCPFCYVAQDRNRILRDSGVPVVELPVQIHPEIGPGGRPAPPRTGPMYDRLLHEAADAGLELHWSDRIPYSRLALAAAEAVRINEPHGHVAFVAAVFHAYFAEGRDIENPSVLASCAEAVGIDPFIFGYQVGSGMADKELRYAEALAREHDVTAAPTWLVGGRLVVGLRSRGFFAGVARDMVEGRQPDEPVTERLG